MRRALICVTATAVILFGTAAVASARPVVDFGTHKVGTCNQDTAKGCTLRRVWFSNHTGQVVNLDEVSVDGAGFSFTRDPFASSTCIRWFFIPAHGKCYVTIVAGATKPGPNRATLMLADHHQTLREARLVIHGRT